MAVDILPLCFLVLYISGTYSSGLNKISAKTEKLKYEYLHEEQSKSRAFTENKRNNENRESAAVLEEVRLTGTDEEGKSKYVESSSTETELTSSQGPSTSEVPQRSTQTTAKTRYSSTALEKMTPFASTSKMALTFHSVSNLTQEVSSATHSSTSLTNVTHSSANKMPPKDSMEGSSQLFIQTTAKTPNSSNTLDKATSLASNSRSETALISHSVSNIPGVVSSPTDSSISLTNVTHSSINNTPSKNNIEGSSKDTYTQYSSTEVNFSRSKALTNATSQTPEHVLNSSRKTTSKVVIVLAAVGGSLFVIAASMVYMKYRKKTGVLPPEYFVLLP